MRHAPAWMPCTAVATLLHVMQPCRFCRQAQDAATAATQQAADLERQLQGAQAQAASSQQELSSTQSQVLFGGMRAACRIIA